MVEHVQGAGNVNFQRRRQSLRFRFRLLTQEFMQVSKHWHCLRARVLQIVPVDHVDATVNDGFLHGFQSRFAADNQFHQRQDEVAFQRKRGIVLGIVQRQIHGVNELLGRGRDVNDLTAQTLYQRRVFVLRVDDGYIVLRNQKSVCDFPFRRERFAAPRSA